MAIKVRFKLNRKGIREVLTRAETQEMLHAKGEAVAEAVRARGIRVEGAPGGTALPVTVRTSGRGIRARTYVVLDHPSGLAVESKHRVLGGAIDAARDLS